MYKLNLVKRKKKVRRAAIITSIGAIGVTAMVIVAFLGRTVGTFTINLHGDGVELALSEHSDFAEQTTHLSCKGLTSFSGLQTRKYFDIYPEISFQNIHNENTDFTLGQDKAADGSASMRFFKYTFFLKNVGEYNASYDFEVVFTEKKNPSNGVHGIDEYLRMAVFEGIDGDPEYKDKDVYNPDIYAKSSYDKQNKGLGIVKEYVAEGPESKQNDYGLANMFIDDNTLCRITDDIGIGKVKMYTLLFWLEGYDPESTEIPKDGSLRIGANINAYHQKDKQPQKDS